MTGSNNCSISSFFVLFCFIFYFYFLFFQAAQRLAIEDRSRALGEQLDELRRQSQNMANTQKMVEDAIKKKRKR